MGNPNNHKTGRVTEFLNNVGKIKLQEMYDRLHNVGRIADEFTANGFSCSGHSLRGYFKKIGIKLNPDYAKNTHKYTVQVKDKKSEVELAIDELAGGSKLTYGYLNNLLDVFTLEEMAEWFKDTHGMKIEESDISGYMGKLKVCADGK